LLRLFGLEAGLGGSRGLQPVQVVGGALRMAAAEKIALATFVTLASIQLALRRLARA
jgi:hypothetical protein